MSTSQSLLNLNPDYVLEVYQSIDFDRNIPTEAANSDLKRLLQALDAKNFYVEIRPGSIKNLLVFIKLNDLDLTKAVEDSEIKDWTYGINDNVLTGQTDIRTLSTADKLRIIHEILITPKELGGCGITPTAGSWNFVRSITPVSNYEVFKTKFLQSQKENTAFNETANKKNIDFILETFGAKYAYYHYFLNTYIQWLLVLSVFGVFSNFIFKRYSIVFTYVNLIWAVSFYFFWKASQLKLAKQWGVAKNMERAEPPKSSTANEEPTYARLLRQAAFMPTAMLFVGWLILCQFFCFSVEIFLNEIYDGWLKPYLSLVPTILLSAMVPVVTAVYNQFVTRHLKWEGHVRFSTFNYSKIIKTFIFNFLTSYMALFITSFLYLPFGFKMNEVLPTIDTKLNSYVNINVRRDNFAINSLRLNTQYQYFILTNQVVGLALEFILPYAMAKSKAHPKVKALLGEKQDIDLKYEDQPDEAEFLSDVRSMLQLPDFDINDEYRQLVLQFGFLVLFGPVWSLGPFISLIINLLQQKLDFVKLFAFVKTPVPGRTDSIYPWDDFMKALLYVGSFTSVAIALMYHGDIVSSSSRSAVGIKWWRIIGPALVTEHLVVLFVQLGGKILDHYGNYLDKQEIATESDSAIRGKYLDTIYQRKSIEGGSNRSLNDIAALLGIASLAPQHLIRAKAIPAITSEKQTVDKELSKLDAEIEKVQREKDKYDALYEEKNDEIKATEADHVKKMDELATASVVVDDDSRGFINEKNQILRELEVETNEKMSKLEQLKRQKAQLESIKAQKLDSLPSQNGATTQKVKDAITTGAAGATGALTGVAAAAQSKLVDMKSGGGQATPKNENGLTVTEAEEFDWQDGDRLISSKQHINGELKPVQATIDNNDHYEPNAQAVDVEIVRETEVIRTTDANGGATDGFETESTSLSTPSKSSQGSKKGKSPLKKIINKINN